MDTHATGRGAALAALISSALMLAAACAPSPRSVPCQNDGECSAKSDDFAYCLQSRCVECVGRGSCGGNPCVDGVCVIACKDSRDCRGDDVCEGGTCAKP